MLLLILTGCSTKVIEFEPPGVMLPKAIVGQRYFREIYIGYNLEAEPEFLNEDNTKITISPDYLGLHVVPAGKNKLWGYNKLIIQGVPKHTGHIVIRISGMTHSTMYERGQRFDKSYEIDVQEYE
ncbi:hypothetical protein I6U52_25595 [Serratia marcescens]|nr:hypothetical protein [Serratia marcescens]MBH2866212.1 hypothetical protein [Serratia marcescens]